MLKNSMVLASGFLVLVSLASPLALAQSQNLILDVDYESRSLDRMALGVKAELPKDRGAITVDCTMARSGQCSSRATVSSHERFVSAGAHRAEFDTSASKPTIYKEGSKWTYQFSLMVDKGWPVDSKNFIDIVWQFKRFSNYPDMFVAIKGKALVWRITDRRQVLIFDEIPQGTWLDFSFRLNWSSTDAGRVTLVVKNVETGEIKTLNDSGPNMRSDKSLGGYIKWGLYKPGENHDFAPRTVHHDEIRIYRIE